MSDAEDRDAGGRDNPAGRVSRVFDGLNRVLRYEVSIGGLLEAAVWLTIPYLSIGFVWATLHAEETQRIHARLENLLPVGSDVAAFGVTAALWPASMQIAGACPVR